MAQKKLEFGKTIHAGDICVFLGSNNDRYIIKVKSKGWCDEYIDPNGAFFKTGGGCVGTWVHATPEEKNWLLASIAARKSTPKPDVPVINNSYSII